MTGSLLISAPVKAKTRGSRPGMGAANVFFNVVFWFRFQINVNIRCPFCCLVESRMSSLKLLESSKG